MQRLFALVLALAPEPAADDPAQLIRTGDYAGAAAAFERQYEETGDAALLFAQAQALRRAGNCRAALAAFERFIATEPPRSDVDAAREAIAACREILDEAEPPIAAPAPSVPPPTTTPDRPPPQRSQVDPAGAVLLGIGAAIAVTGAGVFGGSYRRSDDGVSSEASLEHRHRVVRGMWGSGLGLLCAGGAMMIAGAIRWGIVARRRSQQTVAIVPGSGLMIRF